WTDQATLDLLRYLVRPAAAARMMLVATFRDDEITRRHPLYPLLPGLAREPNATRLILPRLDEDGLRELIAARHPLSVDDVDRLVDYLRRQTEGNPFFSGEVMAALVEGGAIVRDGDGWRLMNLDRVQVPELVRQVIERRLALLGDEAQRHLAVAAVIGHETTLDLWIEISGADEDALSDTLERAVEARIVEEVRGGSGFRFMHALIRETLYEGIGLLRRRSLHRQVGEALAAGKQHDPDAVAHHFRQAGDDRAYDWLIQAGDRALRSYAWLIAAERYEQAADLIAGDRERAREYGWLIMNVAYMLRYADTSRALAYMEQAANVGVSAGDTWLALLPRMDSAYYRVRLGDMREGVGQMVEVGREMEAAARDGRLAAWEPVDSLSTDAKPVFDYMLRMATERANQAVILYQSLAVIHLVNTGGIHAARELADQLAVVWPPDVEETQHITFGADSFSADGRANFADLYFGRAQAEHWLGEPQQSLQSARIALSQYERIPHYFMMAWCNNRMLQTIVAYQTEQVELRRSVAKHAVDAASRARGVFESDGSPDLFRTLLWILEGRWTEAYSILHACVFPRDSASRLILVEDYALSDLAVICARQGRRQELLALIRDALPDGWDTQPGNQPFESALILHAIAASLALDAGDLPATHAWLAAYDRWLAWSGAILGQVEGHLGWAQYYRKASDLAAAEEQARIALDKASHPRQPLGLIASHRLLGELATERRDLDAAASHLHDALTLADSCAAPFERALTLVALAERAITGGSDPRQDLTEARAICERLEARPTLERISGIEQRIAGG
ncbi:MAG TPA: hypothetical protein VEX37_04085, partial [Thermomicrobiales bacterium]|nr:hypothetical protein [Thermomicrobiales bacterium]